MYLLWSLRNQWNLRNQTVAHSWTSENQTRYHVDMAPKKLPSPYRVPGDYALSRTSRLDQLAKYLNNAADAQRAAAEAATAPVVGEGADAERERIINVLERLRVAAEHTEIARRLTIEFALENELLTQRDVADAIGTSKKAVYDRRHNPVLLSEVSELPAIAPLRDVR